ncbi:MAG: hypothetical protein J3Q66DRAFT_397312 [Benniella sp.]|nr:MAG: hypothetical protein J3Q66DRAFT_397312 [Benniella sp.]
MFAVHDATPSRTFSLKEVKRNENCGGHVFQLYQDKGLSRSHLVDLMKDFKADTSRISSELRGLQQVLEEGDDDDIVKVTRTISHQLRVLCEHAVNTITTLNHSVVKMEIEKKMEAILNART